MAAREIDLTGNALSNPIRILRRDHLAYEFVPGCSVKSVIAALQFEISGADSGCDHADSRESRGRSGYRFLADCNSTRFDMNGDHRNL